MAETQERQKQLAQEYLSDFMSKDTKTWQFKKLRQAWILEHIADPKLLDKEYFYYALSYIRGLQGMAKEGLVERLSRILKEYKLKKSDTSNDSKSLKHLKRQKKRAKKILSTFKSL